MKPILKKLVESNLKNDKETEIKISKTETVVISEVRPNLFKTRFSVNVEYFEKEETYPCYSYTVTEASKPAAIRSIMNRLKEHHIIN